MLTKSYTRKPFISFEQQNCVKQASQARMDVPLPPHTLASMLMNFIIKHLTP